MAKCQGDPDSTTEKIALIWNIHRVKEKLIPALNIYMTATLKVLLGSVQGLSIHGCIIDLAEQYQPP